MISDIEGGRTGNEEIKSMLEETYGKGSSQEIERATANGKMIERIEEMSRTDEQFETRGKMMKVSKRRQREDERYNIFWIMNKTFPVQYWGTKYDAPEVEETLAFWRSINNKSIREGWLTDEHI